MKILFVSTIISTINAFLIPHINMLQKQGHIVEVAANTLIGDKDKLEDIGVRINHVEFQRSPFSKDNLMALNRIKKLVARERYDMVHTHTPIASFLTRLACRNIINLKILYTAHGFHFFRGAPKLNWLIYYPVEKLASRWTDAIITMNSEDYKLAKIFKCRKSNVVYKVDGIGVNLERFSSQLCEKKEELRVKHNYSNHDFILFYAAELNRNKHQDLLIKAIPMLKENIPHIKLLLAGDGILSEEYSNLAKSLHVEKHVDFLGYRKDVPELIAMSDISVSASRREGLPVNVMEAMAMGLPLVVTNCRGNIDLVKDGENGFVIESDDIEEFTSYIEKLYNEVELRKQFGEKSIELVQKYSLENVLEQMKVIYKHHLGGE